jgi:cyanate permease
MTVFVLNALAQLAAGAIIWSLVPETQPVINVESAPIGGSIRDVFRDRTFMIFIGLNGGLWLIIEACKLIPIAMHQRGMDPSSYGAIISVNGIMIVVFQLFVPRLVRKPWAHQRFGARRAAGRRRHGSGPRSRAPCRC